MLRDDWYHIINAEQLDTPALVIYPARVKNNIALVKSMAGDTRRLRPHVKTHKSRQVTRLMLDAGITKFKCATIAEAEMLGMCQVPDVLLAYQPVGPKLQRFINLIQAYPETVFSCLVDNMATADHMSETAQSHQIQLMVYIDLNIGMNRTGIVPHEAFALYKRISGLTGLTFAGLHAYDGHIHDHDLQLREKRSAEAMQAVYQLANDITAASNLVPVIVAGGSPTFPILIKNSNVECSPGTFAYWDRGYQLAFDEQPFLPAALVIARVISLPGDNLLCIDAGHKSISAENELDKRIWFLNAPHLKFISQSEEHLVADVGTGHLYQVGDILYGLPYHVCPTIALYERAITVKGHQLSGEWMNIARDRKINI